MTPVDPIKEGDDPEALRALAAAYLDFWERLSAERALLGPNAPQPPAVPSVSDDHEA